MTDGEFILDVLGDGEEHSLAEILRRSMDERGCGLTTHSRVADLRKKGYTIEHLTVPGAERGHAHTYRLVSLAQPEAPLATSPVPASGSASDDGTLTLFAFAASSTAYRHQAAA